ncbi:MAG: hypothetical protein A2X67_08355 [Ignavibacteria bacterium GWA2_55_11]|nr:MAG: hypothetical protein A2X67_08355 [Ignavibacteria bacterium GWA2_55_11]OGU44248.1 MAG: hypothetical protein A2X68_13610 [Ignavibacteria bacterium GWC2_56_12]OGU63347.1 MAG: hypothetical protein A3C56_12940 [Ignavibacteria bacterium RIFCSPHIGHO2_02_FULL_56_12]OGU69587.1 MAG: hypothetical protein A3H45_08050 [Ignavibacteria bacterium RIFCSPLOWO2_02_FULL_55_14]OGU71486.1 MAG: hypothetical protein A3G43_02480 [Ignavibacteria bacterium RIFCSPLOWO2_12_FULL_56_21]HAV22083.1 hypothetical protei
MKRTLFTLALVAAFGLITESAFAQATATQSVTLAVNAVYKISTSGNPGALTISNGSAGSDNLTAVSDNSTTYSITQNFGNTVKITVHMDAALTAGYTLQMNLASTQGTSLGNVDISNATSGSAVDVVTAIARGADAGQTIGYTFSALASAGTLSSTTKTVTLTLTN